MPLQKDFIDYYKLYYYSRTYEGQSEMKNIIVAFKKNFFRKEDIVALFKQGIDEDKFHEYIDDLSDRLNQNQ